MSQKAEKPSLVGVRLKSRKRDEKEKYDPSTFRDSIIAGLTECGADLDKVTTWLIKGGSQLNYRRYAEALFDTLFAGGILSPGGIVADGTDEKPSRTDICVFRWDGDAEKLREFYAVFYKLIRQYKYLEKSFEDDLKKILMFQKGFTVEERSKLAVVTGIILANGLCTPKILLSLFEEHLVKEGISADFAAQMFTQWLTEKDVASILSALKKQQLDTRLMELFPQNKRSPETFTAFFRERGLGQIADMQTALLARGVKKEAQKILAEMISDEVALSEMSEYVNELLDKNGMSEVEVTLSIWNAVMAAVEWNKKEDLVAEQALKHLKQYLTLLKETAKSGKSELALLVKVQEYCYDNMNFLKVFQKIIMLLYKYEVVSEDVILKWFKDGHSQKGKSVFLEQMKGFVEWLQNAEEESEEEDED